MIKISNKCGPVLAQMRGHPCASKCYKCLFLRIHQRKKYQTYKLRKFFIASERFHLNLLLFQ